MDGMQRMSGEVNERKKKLKYRRDGTEKKKMPHIMQSALLLLQVYTAHALLINNIEFLASPLPQAAQ